MNMLRNTKLYRGDTIYFKISDLLDLDGNPFDLSNKKIVATFKDRASDPDSISLAYFEVNTGTSPELTNGNFAFEVNHEESKNLNVANVHYDIRVVDESTDPYTVTTILNDQVRVYQDISDLGDVVFERVMAVRTFSLTGAQVEILLDDYYDGSSWRQSTYQNPADLLAGILTIDGDGSGLDADLLDGLQADQFSLKADTYSKSEVDTLITGLISDFRSSGFIDYNDTSSASGLAILADTWTDLPNNGLGISTNKTYKPDGVTELMIVPSGYIDISELELGDAILIRHDYTIIPSVNNCLLEIRYVLGSGPQEYILPKTIGRLDSGSGEEYRQALDPHYIYVGDLNTRDHPIKIQIKISADSTVINAGSVIQVLRREITNDD